MKYSPDQKRKAIRQSENLYTKSVAKRKKLEKEFPVTVHLEGSFYIVESKINKICL